MSVEQASRFGSAAAALKCEAGNGWDGMPDRIAVEHAMRRIE
jgi:sulfofructose kinase